MLHTLFGAEQVLVTAVHLLSLCILQTPGGSTHRLGVPVHRLDGGEMQVPPHPQSLLRVQEYPSQYPPSQMLVVYEGQLLFVRQESPLY